MRVICRGRGARATPAYGFSMVLLIAFSACDTPVWAILISRKLSASSVIPTTKPEQPMGLDSRRLVDFICWWLRDFFPFYKLSGVLILSTYSVMTQPAFLLRELV